MRWNQTGWFSRDGTIHIYMLTGDDKIIYIYMNSAITAEPSIIA